MRPEKSPTDRPVRAHREVMNVTRSIVAQSGSADGATARCAFPPVGSGRPVVHRPWCCRGRRSFRRESAGTRRRGSEVVWWWLEPVPQRGRGERLACGRLRAFGGASRIGPGLHPIAGGNARSRAPARTRWGSPSWPRWAGAAGTRRALGLQTMFVGAGVKDREANVESRKAGKRERMRPACLLSDSFAGLPEPLAL